VNLAADIHPAQLGLTAKTFTPAAKPITFDRFSGLASRAWSTPSTTGAGPAESDPPSISASGEDGDEGDEQHAA
jgi:hypothetical protein